MNNLWGLRNWKRSRAQIFVLVNGGMEAELKHGFGRGGKVMRDERVGCRVEKQRIDN